MRRKEGCSAGASGVRTAAARLRDPPPTSAAPAGRRGLTALQKAACNVLVPPQTSCGNLTARTESSWRVSHEALGWTGWAACLETEPGETPAPSPA